MRTACLRVPDLPLAAELRAHPELCGLPVAVASGAGPRAELISVSPEAARLGVVQRSSVAHARAICSELCVRIASPALEEAARAAMLDVALSFSPRTAPVPRTSGAFAAEAAVFLDASGVEALFRSETGFAGALAARAAKLGLPGTVAIASSRNVALLAARADRGILEPGRESSFLTPLPLDILDPEDALAEAFTRFGVRTVGDLLGLPRRALATRLGPQVLELVALARGEETGTPLPAPTDAALCESIDLEFPVDRLEPLCFDIQRLLSRLQARLEIRHLCCGDLRLALELAGGGREARRIGVAAPTRERPVLMRLVSQALETHPPVAAVLAVSLETEGRAEPDDQLDLFRPAGPAPTALGRTLAELESLCGRGQVGAPRVADDLHPDAFGLAPFGPGRADRSEAPPPAQLLALRMLRPPLPAEVRLSGGHPVQVRSAIANGRVVSAAGPWRTTGRWWSKEQRFAYDHFDVQTSDGTVSRLRLDHVHQTWHVDAVYD